MIWPNQCIVYNNDMCVCHVGERACVVCQAGVAGRELFLYGHILPSCPFIRAKM